MNFNILCKGLRGHKKRGSSSDYLKSKLILIMKLTTVLMIVCCLHVSAAGYSQNITITEKNAPLKKVLQQIRKQLGFQLLYDSELIKKSALVTLDVVNAPIGIVLDKIFSNQPFSFSIYDKTILVKEKVIEPRNRDIAVLIIEGTVKGIDGSPLPGVSVKVRGSNKATATKADGKFSINAPEENTILIFSCVGMISVERIAKQGMVVVMQPELNKLNDLVVVGYGSTRRKDLTGSVASISVNEIKDVPFATVDQALSGKAAGVQVVQADGSPGGVAKIRIRGGTSLLGGNDPLYIIDGVQVQIQNRYLQSAADIVSPVERFGNDNPDVSVSGSFARGLNSLGGLNINDIETIDILKDASATAIYGSRAANGVVIITTKKGKQNQKPVLEANYYAGVSVPKKEKLLDRDQYIMVVKEAAKNLNDARAAKIPALTPNALATQILTDPTYFGTANTDWMGLVLRNGITQNADISVRGGGTGSRYYTSVAYNKNEGTVHGTDYTRLAGKVSLDNEISSKLRFNTNLDYGFSTNNITNGLYTQAMYAPPTVDPYNPDGSIKIIDPASIGAYAYEGFQNPLLLLKGVNKSNAISLIGSIAAEYDILKDLKFRSSVAINYYNYRQNNYVPSTVAIATSNGTGSSNNGTATQAQSQDVNTFYENTLTWDKEFNENNRLNLLVGTSWQISKSNSFSASGQGFPDDTYLNNLSSAAVTLPSTGVSAQNSLLSFYMRANYALFEKYLFTFTGRSDASSKFPQENRVGYFPSGGVAWRISQENFLKDVKWINEIKLRASAGYTGTQNIGDNLFYTLYAPVSYAGLNGLSPSQLGNNTIKWESTLQKDAGIDFAFFNSRLRGGIGYYEKSTTGVLFPATVATSSGFSGVTANIANIRNRGLELELRGDFVRNRDFQWSGTFNISGNRSKVLALSNDFADPANPTVYNYGNTVLKVGEPLGLLYGRVFDGLLKTQAEVDAYKKASLFVTYGITPYVGIGDARYILDAPVLGYFKDEVIGKAEPKYYGGYTNSLTYKNFSLMALATFSYGGDIFYLADVQNQDVSKRTNKGVKILERWTPENSGATRPRLILGQSSYSYAASNNVYDASFVKLKSVTFSYQFPKTLTDKLKLTGASAYISATNLFTITNYPGVDPEVSNDPYSLIGGYSDSGGYPAVKQFSFGLRFGF
ncbi:TonB-dependent receptor [Pedobacter nyackensis]|uniref:TonB-linked outer membrane protein, SusC/RagA family n=1 Tax=Pedobacter nyackensis TaxID=475255 RepID=A0A1W2ERW0_9SPHI|nr:TonB-dependent receptor [Pedobacter nyackensis]SMD12470.1 TonB-linked outer membrane protein, SusC/RagA family [Pedobacter nyackensis]